MERETWKLTLPYVKQTASGNLLYANQGSITTRVGAGGEDGEEGRREGQEAGDICIPMAN